MEQFLAVDIKEKKFKDKAFYYIVVYSNLEYLIYVYCSKEQYETLKNIKDWRNVDIGSHIEKLYNKKTEKFSYIYK